MVDTGTNEEETVNEVISNIGGFVDELIPIDNKTDEVEEHKDERRVIYELLDEVANGRRLMNCLFHSNVLCDTKGAVPIYESNQLQKQSSKIAQQWFEVEKRTTSQATSAALQIDAPVIFSWSKKSPNATDSEMVNTKKSSKAPTNETTNQIFFKSISARLNQIAAESKDWQTFTQQGAGNDMKVNETSPQKSQWANSSFHVDPLQTFVAQALPKETKRESPIKKKSASRGRNLFNFWGKHNKHSKDKNTTKEDITQKVKERDMRTQTAPAEFNVQNQNQDQDQDQLNYRGSNTRPNTTQDNNNGITPVREQIGGPQEEDKNEANDEVDEYGNFEQVSESPSYSTTAENQTLDRSPPLHPTSVSPLPSLEKETESPLSMNSFIPLQPKKKTNSH